MNNHPQRDNSSLWFLLGGFLSVTLVAFLNRFLSRPATPPASPPQPIHVDVQLPEQPTNQQPERVNWDVIGFASVAVTLVSAAIFYIAGWFYEGYWHAYFGIDIAQINVSPYRVMLQGSAGIFILTLSFIIAIITSPKQIYDRSFYDNTTFLVNAITRTPGISFIIVALLGVIFSLWSSFQGATFNFDELFYLILSAVFSVLFLFAERLLKWLNNIRQRWDSAKSQTDDLVNTINIINSVRHKMIIKHFTNTWPIWINYVLVSLLILSLIFSAIFGRFEAKRGAKFLSGNWQLEEVFIVSELPLAVFSEELHFECLPNYGYGPISQVSANEQNYFFVDWKEGTFFQSQPNLYVIPNNEKNNIQLLYPSHGVELSCE